MKINEVEALVGITRKNIRFYESEGLLTPRRNSENGYRDYGEGDVAVLRQIKLMRKLGVSLEEIRQMQSGTHTVGDGMRRHLISLERDRRNLEESIALCTRLTDCQERLIDLDAEAVLTEMTALEQSGTTFQDKQRRDVRGADSSGDGLRRRDSAAGNSLHTGSSPDCDCGGSVRAGAEDTGDRERRGRRCKRLLTAGGRRLRPLW